MICKAVAGVGLIGLIGLIAPMDAWAQAGLQTRFGAFTNCATQLITSGATSNINAQVYVWRHAGMAIVPKFAAANTTTTNLDFVFALSADGTNWSTHTLTYSEAFNSTTAVIGYTNFPADTLDNVRWLRLASIYNRSATNIWVTNVTWSVFP